MGNIKTQAILATLFSYFGVIAGFVTSALLLPKYLEINQLGLIKLITASIGLLSSIFSLGVVQFFYRTYAQFSNEVNKRNQLFYFGLKLVLFGSLLAFPVFYFFRNSLINYSTPTPEFNKTAFFLIAVFVAIVARILYNSIFGYIRMLGKVVIDAFVQNIVYKAGLLVIVILFVFNQIDFSNVVYLTIFLSILFPVIGWIYLMYRQKFPAYSRGKFFSRTEKREFINLSFFGSLAAVGGSLYIYLDTFMVNYMLDEKAVGIYGTMFLFGVLVSIPARNLKSVSVSYISSSFATNDIDKIQALYQRSSNTLLAIGGVLFLGIISNMHVVFKFLPEAFSQTYWIVFFIGSAQLIDMLTSINIEILASSKHYKLNTLFVFISIITAAIFNLLLIPVMGLNGAAIGTFLAIFMNNLVRCIALWKYYGLQPISKNSFKLILLIIFIYFLLIFIPHLSNLAIDFLFRGTLITLTYFVGLYYLRAAIDINKWIDDFLVKLKLRPRTN